MTNPATIFPIRILAHWTAPDERMTNKKGGADPLRRPLHPRPRVLGSILLRLVDCAHFFAIFADGYAQRFAVASGEVSEDRVDQIGHQTLQTV